MNIFSDLILVTKGAGLAPWKMADIHRGKWEDSRFCLFFPLLGVVLGLEKGEQMTLVQSAN